MCETNEDENTMYQNLWEAERSLLRQQYTVINFYMKKRERFQINMPQKSRRPKAQS